MCTHLWVIYREHEAEVCIQAAEVGIQSLLPNHLQRLYILRVVYSGTGLWK